MQIPAHQLGKNVTDSMVLVLKHYNFHRFVNYGILTFMKGPLH